MAPLQEGERKEGEKWEMGCEGGRCMMGEGRDVGREMWGWGGKEKMGRRRYEREECEGGSERVFRWFSCHSPP